MGRPHWFLRAGLILALAVVAPWTAAGETFYGQQPDIHGDRLVFCAERDLWTVGAGGGTAIRLTTHDGNEYFPHFSPDGARIAFSAAYDGNLDAYVIPATGGEPRRLTWHGSPDMWTGGLVEFNTWFYPQVDKEGMVVDTRWNGGGAVSQQILERLRRPLLSFSRNRGGGVGTYPDRVLNGPFVVLINQGNGSDGDIFPKAVQLNGLAPVIGMRSWAVSWESTARAHWWTESW